MNTARAERLAAQAFFQKCQTFQNWAFAELPVAFELRHQVAIKSPENALYCSCSFFPKPCLHALAFAQFFERSDPNIFIPAEQLPNWITTLAGGQAFILSNPKTDAEQRSNQQAQRHLARLERAERGFEDLEMWLLDTLRRGLATALSEDPDFYQNIAARLADASMRGMGRNFRLLDALPAGQADWAEQSCAALADAALALQAFRARDQLPPALVYDLEAYIGISLKKEQVREQGEALRDIWVVTGSVEEPVEAALRLRRTWLLGQQSERFALLLEYAHGGLDFQPGFPPGEALEGALIFYPSAFPLRVLVAEALVAYPGTAENLPGFEHIENMAMAYAAALGVQPWLVQFPVMLHQLIPYREKNRFRLTDGAGKSLPLINTGNSGWQLLALSGGRPISVFGEWNGSGLFVISALTAGGIVPLDEHPF